MPFFAFLEKIDIMGLYFFIIYRMFEIWSEKWAVDPEAIVKGELSFLMVTLTSIEEKDEMKFYTWTSGKKKGMFEVEFSHRMLCDTKEEIIEKSIDLTKKAIESLEKGVSVCLESMWKLKTQKKSFEKQIREQGKILSQLEIKDEK